MPHQRARVAPGQARPQPSAQARQPPAVSATNGRNQPPGGGVRPLRKVLVANRGEIALRVIRASRELGIASVAVYSDADAQAPHVHVADEAVRIGPAPSPESYLKGEAIIAAAQAAGADAIHPGYGFLSEREWFARAVRDAGLVWVGPPAEAIAAMGSKTAARKLAVANDVPVVPGNTEALSGPDEAERVAAGYGFPVLLKAAAGGGGKGMRVVNASGEMRGAWEAARREAMQAFGDDAVYVEKFIEGPRHVEIQVIGDQHGAMMALGERECSVQRRHQKMIEEAPSPAVTADLRARMCAAAVRVARAAGYSNAGTCEFLLDRAGNFYFLEMNTRIQVEHPVTEYVTGMDLVQWQLRVANGEALPDVGAIEPRGWAIECRITSEDPSNGFLPSTGRIEFLRVPAGPGVRWDSGVEAGSVVGLHYDPMLAKLIAWGATREEAVARMHRALLELVVDGIETSREFHLRVMEDPEFRAGAVDIQWLERRLPALLESRPSDEDLRRAAIAAALTARRDSAGGRAVATGGAGSVAESAWVRAARSDGMRCP
ncbi:MAG: acetyl-CoA carboxylase biotin carboxylase subunit [Gemmatimonadaceae bacterium]|nr:acetyl-CoA carboxylase biotin carboxylase subunit [Gemmatimonadaceae bacterium]